MGQACCSTDDGAPSRMLQVEELTEGATPQDEYQGTDLEAKVAEDPPAPTGKVEEPEPNLVEETEPNLGLRGTFVPSPWEDPWEDGNFCAKPEAPPPAEPKPEPAQPEPPHGARGPFVVEVEKKPGDDKVGLLLYLGFHFHGWYLGGKKHKNDISVKDVRSGLFQTYNESAAEGKIVAAGNHIIEVNGITTPPDAMLAAIAKDTHLRIVFKSA